MDFINTFDPLFIGYFDWPFVLMRSKLLLVLMIPSDVFRLISTWIAFFHFISLVYVMSKTKYNRRCVLDHIYKSLFWPLLTDCFELQREQNIFRIFWEGNLNLWRKINSTDGAKSEHCYALCSRIRLRFESKIWNLNVQIMIAN